MAEKVLFESQSLDFSYNEMFGVFVSVVFPPPFSLALGEKYQVVWDGAEYEVTAIDTSAVMPNTVGAGNGAAWGYAGNNEPFVILYTEGSDISFISLTDTAPNTHTVSVYQMVEDAILYTVSSTSLKKVADAIREKSGSADPIEFPDGFVQKISSISVGGGGDSGIVVEEITDSWEDIIAAVNDGTYKTKYKPGNYKPITHTYANRVKTFNMQLVAFDKDILADGSGYAATTWLSQEVGFEREPIDTGSGYGWSKSNFRNYYFGTYLRGPLEQTVVAAVKPVIKYQQEYINSVVVENSTTDDFWAPSVREMFGGPGSGPSYVELFPDAPSRVKYHTSSKDAKEYWLRDVHYYASSTKIAYFRSISDTGDFTSRNGGQDNEWAFGFCI